MIDVIGAAAGRIEGGGVKGAHAFDAPVLTDENGGEGVDEPYVSLECTKGEDTAGEKNDAGPLALDGRFAIDEAGNNAAGVTGARSETPAG